MVIYTASNKNVKVCVYVWLLVGLSRKNYRTDLDETNKFRSSNIAQISE